MDAHLYKHSSVGLLASNCAASGWTNTGEGCYNLLFKVQVTPRSEAHLDHHPCHCLQDLPAPAPPGQQGASQAPGGGQEASQQHACAQDKLPQALHHAWQIKGRRSREMRHPH